MALDLARRLQRERGASMSKRKDAACEITVFNKAGGVLTKKIELAEDGSVVKDGSECRMIRGSAHRTTVPDLYALAVELEKLRPYQAIALGTLRDGLPNTAKIVTKKKLNGAANTIARTRGEIIYREKHPAFVQDTLIEPVRRAIGHWNFEEVSPQMIMGEFTGFLKSGILRVNEARDLGDVNRYQFHDHMKQYTAAPPVVLRVNEKHLREYSVLNCVGVIITSNHKTDGIFLPAEDRRHFVAWSESVKEDFDAGQSR